ncbi:MAG: bifunctional phosphopantothenoylcysteine decarboxylase/phosphopantothenate--cysteine ligase CoaBC [Chitinophagaceae bacterium]|nr:bifunctional phosphopantothenoylcysteine decarboxylase/phosphopantothenate--cysteine ligase CoaBC [Chitinophagaceae bacterium]
MLKGKKILLGITGSIAAYKSIFLTRLLVKNGAEVKIIVTPSAKDFVTPLTLSTLSGNKVLVELFHEESWSNHVMLGRWADLMLIAPLSCNTMAKMANGLCDNLLMAVYLSATCPVLLAPAMDEDMWKHPSTKNNLEKLKAFGNHILPVNEGFLASGLNGEGRMAEPEQIIEYMEQRFFLTGPLKGKKALVTAGPTYEALDPVRFIGNHSTGKMGTAIARELKSRGAEVVLVAGPNVNTSDLTGIEIMQVTSAAQMYQACLENFEASDLTIMAAAVADYEAREVAGEKIKKKEEYLTLELKKTTDILKALGEKKSKGQILVGFALETENEKQHAKDKLVRKNADLIILNSLRDEGAGFGHDTNKITIFGKEGDEWDFDLRPKAQVAKDIVDTIISKFYA